jgi:hypothetical protein
MKIKDAANTLKALGWSVYSDEVGDRVADYALLDRTISLIYRLDRIGDQQKFGAMLSVSTEAFSEACRQIHSRKAYFPPLVNAWKGIDIRASEILEEHVRQASQEAIAWAQAQDLDKALRDYAALPTNAPGALPLWHLAALGLLGDVAKLKFYQASFEAGDRLDFVPYISKDHIDRALLLAERKATA